MSGLSRDKLIEFLEWTAEKGLLKRATAQSLRSACNAVMAVMDEEESADISKVDLETVIRRYQNLHSMNVSPNTMRVYGRRVKQAVDEFVRFNQDKANWKPSSTQRVRKLPNSSKNSKRESHEGPEGSPHSSGAINVSEITHQFPLRHDMIVTIRGIPFDVKRSEMARLNAFLSNLVAISDEEHQQLMLPSGVPQTGDQSGDLTNVDQGNGHRGRG